MANYPRLYIVVCYSEERDRSISAPESKDLITCTLPCYDIIPLILLFSSTYTSIQGFLYFKQVIATRTVKMGARIEKEKIL